MRRRMAFACAVLAMATVISGMSAQAANGGFKTSRPSMLTKVMDGVTITPILSVGRRVRGQRLPVRGHPGRDLAADPRQRAASTLREPRDEQGAVPVRLRAHRRRTRGSRGERLRQFAGQPARPEPELGRRARTAPSRSPAAAASSGSAPTTWRPARRGSTATSCSRTRSHRTTCSGRRNSWPPPLSNAGAEENGVVLALDIKSKQYHVIYGMGRHNHENDVAIPGFDNLVVLSGDDTFTSGPLTIPRGGPQHRRRRRRPSPSCTRTSRRTRDSLLADEGELWAFVSDNTELQRLLRLRPRLDHSP